MAADVAEVVAVHDEGLPRSFMRARTDNVRGDCGKRTSSYGSVQLQLYEHLAHGMRTQPGKLRISSLATIDDAHRIARMVCRCRGARTTTQIRHTTDHDTVDRPGTRFMKQRVGRIFLWFNTAVIRSRTLRAKIRRRKDVRLEDVHVAIAETTSVHGFCSSILSDTTRHAHERVMKRQTLQIKRCLPSCCMFAVAPGLAR